MLAVFVVAFLPPTCCGVLDAATAAVSFALAEVRFVPVDFAFSPALPARFAVAEAAVAAAVPLAVELPVPEGEGGSTGV